MHELGLCIKVDSYVAHMFFALSFSYNTSVHISIKRNKYFPYLNIKINIFSWGAGNKNKNRTKE